MLNFPGLTFKRGENIAALRTTVQHFAATEIAPRAADIDRNDQFPMDLWKKMGSLGLLGFTGDEAHGGIDMGYLAHIVAMEKFHVLRHLLAYRTARILANWFFRIAKCRSKTYWVALDGASMC